MVVRAHIDDSWASPRIPQLGQRCDRGRGAHTMKNFSIRNNGYGQQVNVEPDTPLLYVLRSVRRVGLVARRRPCYTTHPW
jgi:hypothetical protein